MWQMRRIRLAVARPGTASPRGGRAIYATPWERLARHEIRPGAILRRLLEVDLLLRARRQMAAEALKLSAINKFRDAK